MAALKAKTGQGRAPRARRAAPQPRKTHVDELVAARIKARRLLAGLSQTDLAAKIGVTFQALQKYETGENRISASRLYQLSRVLEVSMGYFFEGLDGTGQSDDEAVNSDLSRKEAAMVLGTYYRISDPRLRSACLLIMGRMADRAEDESA